METLGYIAMIALVIGAVGYGIYQVVWSYKLCASIHRQQIEHELAYKHSHKEK